ncbi:hypothetical protein, partial [Nocardia brasiliensis]|uniref:hypothetical protein n=1 Tax=Nocardia brasiliensis TaxID=37326 RepID=UPI0024556275
HTVVTMVELGRYREAVAFATSEHELTQTLNDRRFVRWARPRWPRCPPPPGGTIESGTARRDMGPMLCGR